MKLMPFAGERRSLEYNLYSLKGVVDKQIELTQKKFKEFQEKYYNSMPTHHLLLEIAMKHYAAMFTVPAHLKQPLVNDGSHMTLKTSWATYGDPERRDPSLDSVLKIMKFGVVIYPYNLHKRGRAINIHTLK